MHNYVDVAAPGVEIESAKNTGGRETVQGTSSAAALTAGVVALIRAQNPDLAPRQVADILRSTASQGGSHDPMIGHGVIDAEAAVALAAETEPEDRLIAPAAYDGPAHFGPGDDGTPASVKVGYDTGDMLFGAVFAVPGLLAATVGLGLVISAMRAKRARA